MSIRFDGKVAIVTGAGGGLGRAHALELAARGARVVVNDLGGDVAGGGRSDTAAERVVGEIEAAGGEAMANGASVTDAGDVAALVEETVARFGRIDIVINNAGILRDKSFAQMQLADFEAVLDVHLTGAARVTQAAWPVMREQGYGRVLVTTSASGLYGNFGQANYGAAKLGLVGLINTLKLEGQKYDIRCNALAPVAYTRMTADLFPPEAEQLMRPEQVAPAAAYLVSEEAPSGVILAAGGGCFAKVEIREARGACLGAAPSAEDIAGHWDEITEMDGARSHFMAGEQTGKFFEMLSRGR